MSYRGIEKAFGTLSSLAKGFAVGTREREEQERLLKLSSLEEEHKKEMESLAYFNALRNAGYEVGTSKTPELSESRPEDLQIVVPDKRIRSAIGEDVVLWKRTPAAQEAFEKKERKAKLREETAAQTYLLGIKYGFERLLKRDETIRKAFEDSAKTEEDIKKMQEYSEKKYIDLSSKLAKTSNDIFANIMISGEKLETELVQSTIIDKSNDVVAQTAQLLTAGISPTDEFNVADLLKPPARLMGVRDAAVVMQDQVDNLGRVDVKNVGSKMVPIIRKATIDFAKQLEEVLRPYLVAKGMAQKDIDARFDNYEKNFATEFTQGVNSMITNYTAPTLKTMRQKVTKERTETEPEEETTQPSKPAGYFGNFPNPF